PSTGNRNPAASAMRCAPRKSRTDVTGHSIQQEERHMNVQTTATPDLAAIKAKQQATWASGDYAVVGTTLQIVGENLCEAVDLRAGSRVLDVAAGNGNATLAAARRFAQVTSTDYVPSLLEAGRRRAEAEGLAVDFQPADAENL